MNKMKIKMNNPVYIAVLVLNISNIVMYEYWCDYLKSAYANSAKLYGYG